ncbi:MAG: hypothetical protein IJ087_16575 [Eggerthellaceae bacterium]|nr:hypothetical protein [Eggerthellaceae bacterium]
MSFNAQPGDIYLDEESHTAMCIQNDGSADLLGEFSISENGTIDGQPGDQTGRESSIHGCYEAWDGILHYNGKADGGASPAAPAAPAASDGKGGPPMPRYRVAVMDGKKKVWLDWVLARATMAAPVTRSPGSPARASSTSSSRAEAWGPMGGSPRT